MQSLGSACHGSIPRYESYHSVEDGDQTDSKKAQEAYDKFNKVFFAKNKAALPQLACNITNEQWLDTISCPRLDPINPNKRSMTTRSGDDDLSSTDSEGEYYTDSEDESEEEAEDESEAEVERATDKGDNDLYGAD